MELITLIETVKDGITEQLMDAVKVYIESNPIAGNHYYMDESGVYVQRQGAGRAAVSGLTIGINLDSLIDSDPAYGIDITDAALRKALQDVKQELTDALTAQSATIRRITRITFWVDTAEYLGLDTKRGSRHAMFRLSGQSR